MSENNNNLIENLSDKVKAFLQSPDDFPVLEPHQWYSAIIKFVQTESITALNKHYGNDGDQASISATGLSPAEQQQQAKERKIKKIELEKELLTQIQLDLVHNLTNGTIEDYWLMYQQALREEHEEEVAAAGDDHDERETNGTASASKTSNTNDVNTKTKKKKNASIVDTIDLTRLTWPEIEKVAWKNYRIFLEKKAEEEERQRKKKQQQEEDEDEEHQHDENDGDEVVPVAPSEIVSPDSKNKQQHDHATMLNEKTLREREKKIAKDEANINNDINNDNNSNKNNINLEDETILEHLRNDALRPFRVQYERAFVILDKQLFDHTGSFIELDAFCQWTTVSFNPPYEQKEGEPNNRLGSIVNWLYLPNYAMNQDEDLVIDSYPLLREVRYIARDFPDCNLVKEGYCLEIFAHQTRDQFCGTMIQLADKPWSHSYPVIMNAFASSLRILAHTEKMVQVRDKRRKMKKLKEMTSTTSTATADARKDDDGDDATSTGSATTMSSTTTAATEPSTIKRSPNYYYGSTLIKILSRAKPSSPQVQQQQQDHHQLAEKKKNIDNDNSNDTAAVPPQIMGQVGNNNSEESKSSIEIISPVLSPRANEDDDDDENDNDNDNDQKDEKDRGEGRYHLSKADAAEIACTMTRCAPPSDFAAVIAAVREYEIMPPRELNHNHNNNNDNTNNNEKVPCYDIVIPNLHLPVVVFKDPSLGFLCRSSTLAEDWCVIQ